MHVYLCLQSSVCPPSLPLPFLSHLSCLQVDCVSDLLKSLKALMVRCCVWDRVTTIDNLRLDTTHRMLNIPHFNAKMNALKEVVPYHIHQWDGISSVFSGKVTTGCLL